jgi:tRNA pseudouridine32 synthase / 23S rRNA pseudouridine746 synthase
MTLPAGVPPSVPDGAAGVRPLAAASTHAPGAGLTLVHADDALLVFDKPAGLLAVPGRGPDKQDCLSARAQARFGDALVVHRLDMATSGLIVLARGAAAQSALSRAFQRRRVHKHYEAVVAGTVTPPTGEDGWGCIDAPLLLDWLDRPRSKVDPERGKPSRTRWRVIGPETLPDGAPATRLALEPVTGRSHQLRVHLLSIGHPIVGDPLYAPAALAAASPRLLLHACALALDHPVSGETMNFRSPTPF